MISNESLRERLRGKRLSDRRFADGVGVSVKTVHRWLADVDYRVREENARRAADVLGCTPHDLWPQQYPAWDGSRPATTSVKPFMPTVYATRSQVPPDLWQQHFGCAQRTVDILVFAATFLFDTVDGFVDTLIDAAERGVAVRMLIGNPESASMILRGQEEAIGEAVVARCRTTAELLAPRATTPGLQIRMHQTTLYTSMFRVDDCMIANYHIYGSPGRNNPVMVFARPDEPRLWATLEQAFDRVWENATPLIN